MEMIRRYRFLGNAKAAKEHLLDDGIPARVVNDNSKSRSGIARFLESDTYKILVSEDDFGRAENCLAALEHDLKRAQITDKQTYEFDEACVKCGYYPDTEQELIMDAQKWLWRYDIFMLVTRLMRML